MNILALDERVSLEFAVGEFDKVMRGLGRFGTVVRQERTTYDILNVENEEFVLMNDWDDPCLISKSPEGDAMLRSICAAQSPSDARAG